MLFPMSIVAINFEGLAVILLNNLDKSLYRFVQKKDINDLALPSLIKKILNLLKKDKAVDL